MGESGVERESSSAESGSRCVCVCVCVCVCERAYVHAHVFYATGLISNNSNILKLLLQSAITNI